eukprot:gene3260-2242_t
MAIYMIWRVATYMRFSIAFAVGFGYLRICLVLFPVFVVLVLWVFNLIGVALFWPDLGMVLLRYDCEFSGGCVCWTELVWIAVF